MIAKYDESNYIENLEYFDSQFYAMLDKYPFDSLTITKEISNRPDLISRIAYGTDDLVPIIKNFNRVFHFNEFSEGRVIKLPQPRSIDLAIRDYLELEIK